MTVFTAIKEAALRADGSILDEAFASTEQIAVEMCSLVNSVALDISRSADWRGLTKEGEFIGDGVQTDWPIPEDYDRMIFGSDMADQNSWFWNYFPIQTVNEWMRRRHGWWIVPGGWIILDNKFKFWPAPTGIAAFPYISNHYVISEAGIPKGRFDRDDDNFVLDEECLMLGLLWRWKAQKDIDYDQDKALYDVTLTQVQARDKGSRMIKSRGPWPFNSRIAYPWNLG